MKKMLSALAILSIALLPNLTLAQEEAPITEEVITPVEEPVTQETVSVQESDPSQETLPSEDLESTENPQEQQPPAEAIDIIDTADEEDAILQTASSTEVIETIEATTTEKVAELPVEVLEPQKEYSFEINGSAIATDETPDWVTPLEASEVGEESVTEAPALDTSEPHTLTVSGECVDSFYVILIYEHQEDYNANPSSYIFNRAFPCENGHYSYDLKELPFNLETGTFYIMVAGQGNKGPWKPITALIPIGVTVKTIIPPVIQEENEPAE